MQTELRLRHAACREKLSKVATCQKIRRHAILPSLILDFTERMVSYGCADDASKLMSSVPRSYQEIVPHDIIRHAWQTLRYCGVPRNLEKCGKRKSERAYTMTREAEQIARYVLRKRTCRTTTACRAM